MIHSKQHWGCIIQDPGTVATGGEKQPTFRTARAQRADSARCAPSGLLAFWPPITRPRICHFQKQV